MDEIGTLVKDTKCFQDVIRFFFSNADITQGDRRMLMMENPLDLESN